jgi:hypothetical protein
LVTKSKGIKETTWGTWTQKEDDNKKWTLKKCKSADSIHVAKGIVWGHAVV